VKPETASRWAAQVCSPAEQVADELSARTQPELPVEYAKIVHIGFAMHEAQQSAAFVGPVLPTTLAGPLVGSAPIISSPLPILTKLSALQSATFVAVAVTVTVVVVVIVVEGVVIDVSTIVLVMVVVVEASPGTEVCVAVMVVVVLAVDTSVCVVVTVEPVLVAILVLVTHTIFVHITCWQYPFFAEVGRPRENSDPSR